MAAITLSSRQERRPAQRSSSSSRCSTIDSACISSSATCLPPSLNDAPLVLKQLSTKLGTAHYDPVYFYSYGESLRTSRPVHHEHPDEKEQQSRRLRNRSDVDRADGVCRTGEWMRV